MEIGRPYSRLLHRLEMLQPLLLEDRRRIADLPMTVVNVAPHGDLRQCGKSEGRCTIVVSGFLCATQRSKDYNRQITSIFVPGDIADLHSLYVADFDCELAALGSAVVAFVPQSALKSAIAESPALNQALWTQSLVHAATVREWLTNLGRRNATSRVAHLICEIAARLQAVELAKDLRFSIAWTQADIADACGISNVHANRVLQRLRRDELLDFSTRSVLIRDWDALADLGNFSAEYLLLNRTGRRVGFGESLLPAITRAEPLSSIV